MRWKRALGATVLSRRLLLVLLLGSVGILLDGERTVDDGLEGDEALAAGEAQRLELVVDVHHVVVVASEDLDEQVVIARRDVALHHLGNLLQGLHHAVEVLGILQIETDIGAGLVADLLGVDEKLRSQENAQVGELLYALVDSGTTHVSRTCYFEERNASVFCDKTENLAV